LSLHRATLERGVPGIGTAPTPVSGAGDQSAYRELVTKAEAEAWFAVMPDKPAANVVEFSRQAVG